MKSTENYLSHSLRYARERSGLSASALSRAIGRSPSYVSKVESGDLEASSSALSRMMLVLGLTDLEMRTLTIFAANRGLLDEKV